MEIDKSKPILVSGASGFLASHCVHQLLQAGYKVRGTVRSLKNPKKVEFLSKIVPERQNNLELVEADLLDANSWDRAVKGCDYVLHVASPFVLGNLTEDQIVKPAVEGTLNILNASLKHGVKKVVVTSSTVAIWYGNFDKVCTEKDWSQENLCPPYEKSKLRAEKATWDFYEKNKDKIQISVINPGLILGPVFNYGGGSSENIIRDIIMKNMPGTPRYGFMTVDVRDVALAHIRAMESQNSNGERYLCASETMWFNDIATILDREFRPYGYKCAKSQLPDFIVKFASCWEKRLKNLVPNLGKTMRGDNSKIKKELGMEFRPVGKAIIEMGHSLIEEKAIPDKRKGKKK